MDLHLLPSGESLSAGNRDPPAADATYAIRDTFAIWDPSTREDILAWSRTGSQARSITCRNPFRMIDTTIFFYQETRKYRPKTRTDEKFLN